MIASYLKYIFSAGNRHGLHSPFVYDLYENVICDPKHYYAYDVMESLRAKMLLSDEVIETQDFGTGGKNYPVKRPVRFIASRFASTRKNGQLLFRLVNHFRPQNILEMGTSLGMSTGYMALAHTASRLITLEGCPETARLAENNFRMLKLSNVMVEKGGFGTTLSPVVESMPSIDFAYIDGNHLKEATLEYYHIVVKKVPLYGVVILDDIHWSRGMEEAWNEIRRDSRVTTSIDLYRMGLLFFQKGLASQHFVLKF